MTVAAGHESGLAPTLQTDERSLWERLPVTLWSILSLEYARPIDLEGTVVIRLRERVTDHPEGEVRNETPHALRQAYLHYHGHRCALGDLDRGTSHPVSSAGWERYRMARPESPQTAYPGQGLAPPLEPVGEPAAGSGASAGPTLYELAPVLLRGGSAQSEAVLVARAPTLPTVLRVGGIEERSRASLLLVRAEVRH